MTELINEEAATPSQPEQHAGRDATALAYPLLIVAGLLALVAGLDAFAGSSHTKDFFAWGFRSPVSAALFGAGLLGVVPMMLTASVRALWEEVRIAVLPAGVLVTGMLVISLLHHDELALSGGGIIAVLMSWGWLLAMLALTVFVGFVLLAQLREPGFPLARDIELPRLVLPLIALEGAAFFGLGLGLLIRPDFWGDLIPWDVSTIDARGLGVWSLALGAALLQGLTEGDLDRLQPGLVGLTGIGLLSLVGLVWHHGDVEWASWSGPIAAGLLAALLATGVIGLALLRRGRAGA